MGITDLRKRRKARSSGVEQRGSGVLIPYMARCNIDQEIRVTACTSNPFPEIDKTRVAIPNVFMEIQLFHLPHLCAVIQFSPDMYRAVAPPARSEWALITPTGIRCATAAHCMLCVSRVRKDGGDSFAVDFCHWTSVSTTPKL